ncbi:MAG: NAD(P)-binding domain-containing protein [Desulfarculaceae bacterium]|nr:NAD(P)-binding domain-containing protein [Desulfarculaceae bacterium]MCF8071245.1 NAD(P)-binding domain-containing protein [Desulfarculaceae bacterium]MCF8101152.1 NAD(P)-binding domain-containing protein [Desulfarculaceae bacterium]MCF8115299.1 NAD(P)-binding domain-containing protein [Desulfarculaceae bacterium]
MSEGKGGASPQAKEERGAAPKAAVIGAGTMGHGIAQDLALAGHAVLVWDESPASLERLKQRVDESLAVFKDMGLVSPEQAAACLDNIAPAASLEDACAEAEVVIEAVFEDLSLKQGLFARLEKAAPAGALLVSNTSALRISEIAANMARPERLVGLHFWNPPQVVPCVEVVKGELTTDQVFEEAAALVERLGKEPVRVNKDIPGFLGNRMQHALQREAMSLVESGVASAEDVDRVVKYGFGLRLAFLGPLERADMGGLDVTLKVQDYLLPRLDNRTTASPLLREKVERGELGLKSGQGFYDWGPEKTKAAVSRRDRALLAISRLLRELD